jgi:hypothetical protein
VRLSASLTRGNARAAFETYYRNAQQAMERAALRAVDRGGTSGIGAIRREMQGAGLGRLGQGIGNTSDLKRGGRVKRYPGGGFSVSATLFIRSGSERTRGAIEAYTQGADIRPVRGKWLWIPTDEVQRLVGSGKARKRLTPALWKPYGLDSKIGPLVQVRSVNGYPLLVVRNIGVNAAGLPGKARSLTRKGQPRKGQRAKEFVVAFIGIPRTARAARVDVVAILRGIAAQLPDLWAQEMRKEGKR